MNPATAALLRINHGNLAVFARRLEEVDAHLDGAASSLDSDGDHSGLTLVDSFRSSMWKLCVPDDASNTSSSNFQLLRRIVEKTFFEGSKEYDLEDVLSAEFVEAIHENVAGRYPKLSRPDGTDFSTSSDASVLRTAHIATHAVLYQLLAGISRDLYAPSEDVVFLGTKDTAATFERRYWEFLERALEGTSIKRAPLDKAFAFSLQQEGDVEFGLREPAPLIEGYVPLSSDKALVDALSTDVAAQELLTVRGIG